MLWWHAIYAMPAAARKLNSGWGGWGRRRWWRRRQKKRLFQFQARRDRERDNTYIYVPPPISFHPCHSFREVSFLSFLPLSLRFSHSNAIYAEIVKLEHDPCLKEESVLLKVPPEHVRVSSALSHGHVCCMGLGPIFSCFSSRKKTYVTIALRRAARFYAKITFILFSKRKRRVKNIMLVYVSDGWSRSRKLEIGFSAAFDQPLIWMEYLWGVHLEVFHFFPSF